MNTKDGQLVTKGYLPYFKSDDRLWPPHHVTKLKKIKKDNVKDE